MTKPRSLSLSKKISISTTLLVLILLTPSVSPACPMCADAITTPTAVGSDNIAAVQSRARGFFYSIVGMVSVPFVAISGVALAIRRDARQAQNL
jgi:hypothetical protein